MEYRPEKVWTPTTVPRDEATGYPVKKIGERRVTECVLSVKVVVLVGSQHVFATVTQWRDAKARALKGHISAVEKATKPEWLAAHPEFVGVPEKLRIISRLSVTAQTGRTGRPYAQATARSAPPSLSQVKVLQDFFSSSEGVAALKAASAAFDARKAKLEALYSGSSMSQTQKNEIEQQLIGKEIEQILYGSFPNFAGRQAALERLYSGSAMNQSQRDEVRRKIEQMEVDRITGR